MIDAFDTSPQLKQRKDWMWLALFAALTVVLWQLPFGRYVLYPFTILSTWFHEMGHGLTAMLLGANFQSLQIYSNGSGIATHSGDVLFGSLGQALVAAGGPMGPPIAGSTFIFASRQHKWARYGLATFGIVLILSAVIWIRTLFGVSIILLFGLIIVLFSWQFSVRTHVFAIQFLGVQACISTFRDFNYLFSAGGMIEGKQFASDTAVIAQRLLLPYWFWGILIAVFSIYILVKSLQLAYKVR
ncbi:M50 family metallopeptidase [candidate division KSB1 bacterium]|nr:M50 family metallopeptidase [candidate division KSB1 bacterium]